MVDKKLIAEAIKTLEKAKKKSYSASELRNRNPLMHRLDRIQDRDLSRRISLVQEKLKKDKKFPSSFLLDEDDQGEDEDILKMFGIKKKKKVQKGRGGFWNFVRWKLNTG